MLQMLLMTSRLRTTRRLLPLIVISSLSILGGLIMMLVLRLFYVPVFCLKFLLSFPFEFVSLFTALDMWTLP